MDSELLNQVLPLSKTFGIIEWVREMDRPLTEFIEKSTYKKELRSAAESYSKIYKKASDKNHAQSFIRGVKSAASSPGEFARRVSEFRALVDEVPLFTLRDSLMAKAQTAQVTSQAHPPTHPPSIRVLRTRGCVPGPMTLRSGSPSFAIAQTSCTIFDSLSPRPRTTSTMASSRALNPAPP